MSECRRTRNRLIDYLEGELPEQASAEVAAHLARCPACKQEMAALEASRTALTSLTRAECPDGMWARIESRIRGVEDERSRAWRILSRPACAFATSVALFLLLGLSISVRPSGVAPPTMWVIVSPLSPVGVHVEMGR